MKKLLLAAFVTVIHYQAAAQKKQATPPMLKAAAESLQAIQQLVATEGPDANFIFVPLSGETNKTLANQRIDPASLTLMNPIFVSLIRLDRLKEFQPGKPYENLISYTHKVIFPVISRKSNVLSTIVLDSTNGQWHSSLGEEKEIIQKSISYFMRAKGVLEIFKQPSLNLYFTPIKQEKGFMLLSLQSYNRLELIEGKPESPDNLFSRMAKEAQNVQDLPF